MLSFWEKQTWFTNVDYCIVGGGLVGLSTAIHLRNENPRAKIVVVERGFLPTGASTKNAGFACYGSPSEILDDLQTETEKEVFQKVERRYQGFHLLHSWLGSDKLGYERLGGYEVFQSGETQLYLDVLDKLDYLNKSLNSIFKTDTFVLADSLIPKFGFNAIDHCIHIPNEGQIDTGKALFNLSNLAREKNIVVLNGLEILNFEDSENGVYIHTQQFDFRSSKIAICTNGFAKNLLPKLEVQAARAQVLITKPISNLKFEGVFHMHKGYYYFRNVNDRILLGGGRHLAFSEENTDEMSISFGIQENLRSILTNTILPETDFEVDQSWAGIMGFGQNNNKEVLIGSLSQNVVYGVRLGGMGIAIGASVGKEIAQKLT